MALKTQYGSFTGRYRQNNGSWIDQNIQILEHQQVINIVNTPGQDHPFESRHISHTGARLFGKRGVNEWDGALTAVYSNSFASESLPSNANSSILAMARTNPSRASVLLPTMFWEVKDIPEMLRQAGRVAAAIMKNAPWRNHVDWSNPKSVAAANLAYQFGWAPLIGDMINIATLGDATNKRINELKRLASPKGLRRRITLNDSTRIVTGNTPVWSTGGSVVYADYETSYTLRQWAVVDWALNPNQSYLQNPFKPMPDEVRLVLLGLTSQHLLENVWEALPWSWLYDWFVPMQAAIAAKNTSLARPVSGTIMSESTVSTSYRGRGERSYIFEPGTRRCVRRLRSLLAMNSLPTASIPLLNARQSSVLGSLAILRARPSTGF